MLNRHDYITPIKDVLFDTNKFWNIDIKPGKEKNFIDHRSISFLKSVQNSLSANLYKELSLNGFQSGVMYGLAKIHTLLVNNFPKFRPILSTINTGTHGCAKSFVLSLRRFTLNDRTINDSFEFAYYFMQLNSGLFMYGIARY